MSCSNVATASSGSPIASWALPSRASDEHWLRTTVLSPSSATASSASPRASATGPRRDAISCAQAQENGIPAVNRIRVQSLSGGEVEASLVDISGRDFDPGQIEVALDQVVVTRVDLSDLDYPSRRRPGRRCSRLGRTGWR